MHHVDWATLVLLFSMMILVHLLSLTGFFEWCAVRVAVVARGDATIVFLLLSALSGVLSAFLDNVTCVMLLGPVTISLCRQMKVPSVPFYLTETLAATVGGTATLVGDPPNVVISQVSSHCMSRTACLALHASNDQTMSHDRNHLPNLAGDRLRLHGLSRAQWPPRLPRAAAHHHWGPVASLPPGVAHGAAPQLEGLASSQGGAPECADADRTCARADRSTSAASAARSPRGFDSRPHGSHRPQVADLCELLPHRALHRATFIGGQSRQPTSPALQS